MATRVAINGFGRIGRAFFRLAHKEDDIEIVAVNDLTDIKTVAYLLQYDSAQGKAPFKVESKDGALIAGGKEVPYYSISNPGELPWGDLDVDVVIESTGVFASYEKSRPHIEAGAKRVVISAPVKDGDVGGETVLVGVNEEKLSTCQISSNASCTTNAGAGIMHVLNERLGIEKALLNTVHAYTSSQNIVDGPNKHIRRGRAAGVNIVPSSTGAAIATTKAIRDLEGKFDGVALRVPVVAGSIADITFISKRDTTIDEVNQILEEASKEERWQGIFTVTREPLVSSDIIGTTYASIVDLEMTRIAGGNLVKILAWYDNEMGYTMTLLRHVRGIAKIL